MDTVKKTLRLRPLRPEDAPELHRVLSDPEVMRWLEPPFTLEQTRSFIECAGLARPPLVYAVLRDTRLIGHVIWHPYEPGFYELGWVLARDVWGQGIAGELTALLLNWGREQGLSGVVLECAPQQAVTRHLAERFGFRREADADGLCVYRLRF